MNGATTPRSHVSIYGDHWDQRYMGMAKHIAAWSKDPSTKVGAVIVDWKRRFVSLGFNGLPRGVDDSPVRLENREVKYKMIVHAERNAVLFAARSVEGCTLYTYPFMPCAACASMMVQAGLREIVSYDVTNPRWDEDFLLTRVILAEGGVNLRLIREVA